MPMTDWIAEATFVAHPAQGATREVTLRLGRPAPVGPAEWACAVALDGLHEPLAPVRGADALQALALAGQLVGRLLAAFVQQGGRVTYRSGEEVPLASYGVGPA
jgi:hypothetical protein